MGRHLKGIEIIVPVQRHLVGNPLQSAGMLITKTHQQHGVDRVYYGVPNPTGLSQITSCPTDGMILVVTHGIPLCQEIQVLSADRLQ